MYHQPLDYLDKGSRVGWQTCIVARISTRMGYLTVLSKIGQISHRIILSYRIGLNQLLEVVKSITTAWQRQENRNVSAFLYSLPPEESQVEVDSKGWAETIVILFEKIERYQFGSRLFCDNIHSCPDLNHL